MFPLWRNYSFSFVFFGQVGRGGCKGEEGRLIFCWRSRGGLGLGFVHIIFRPTSSSPLFPSFFPPPLLSFPSSRRRAELEAFFLPPYQNSHVINFAVVFVVLFLAFLVVAAFLQLLLLLLLLLFFFLLLLLLFLLLLFLLLTLFLFLLLQQFLLFLLFFLLFHLMLWLMLFLLLWPLLGLLWNILLITFFQTLGPLGVLSDSSTASAVDVVVATCSYRGTLLTCAPRHHSSNSRANGLLTSQASFFSLAHQSIGYFCEALAGHCYLENKVSSTCPYQAKMFSHSVLGNIHGHIIDGYSCLSGADVFCL